MAYFFLILCSLAGLLYGFNGGGLLGAIGGLAVGAIIGWTAIFLFVTFVVDKSNNTKQ